MNRAMVILQNLTLLFYKNTTYDVVNNELNTTDDLKSFENICSSRQMMLRNLGLHTIILRLLRDSGNVILGIRVETPGNAHVVEFFKLIFRVLRLFSLNNPSIKKLLY